MGGVKDGGRVGGGVGGGRKKDERLGTFTQAMAGAFAGGVSRVTVAPLDVIKIRLQVQVEPLDLGATRGAVAMAGGSGGAGAGAGAGVEAAVQGVGKYRGIIQCASTILKEEGARGLWSGTMPALFLWVPFTAVQFGVLGEFHRVAERNGLDASKAPLSFVGGGVAAGAYTRPLLSSTSAVSDTRKQPTHPKHPNNPLARATQPIRSHPLSHIKRSS